MENHQVEKLKKELVQEIKDLALEISKSNSFVGLLSQEIKFKTLHEKFINLKFLERKHIGLNIFDEPIPMLDKHEVLSLENEDYDDETEDDFQENVINYSENKIEEIELENQDLDKKYIQEEIPQDEDIYVEDENSDELKIMDEDEGLDNEKPYQSTFSEEIANLSIDDVEEFLPKQSHLPKIQLDFNDRMAFLHQLFDGDAQALDLVINTLERIDNVSDSKSYISDLVQEMSWQNKQEYIERLEELILKRFD